MAAVETTAVSTGAGPRSAAARPSVSPDVRREELRRLLARDGILFATADQPIRHANGAAAPWALYTPAVSLTGPGLRLSGEVLLEHLASFESTATRGVRPNQPAVDGRVCAAERRAVHRAVGSDQAQGVRDDATGRRAARSVAIGRRDRRLDGVRAVARVGRAGPRGERLRGRGNADAGPVPEPRRCRLGLVEGISGRIDLRRLVGSGSGRRAVPAG